MKAESVPNMLNNYYLVLSIYLPCFQYNAIKAAVLALYVETADVMSDNCLLNHSLQGKILQQFINYERQKGALKHNLSLFVFQ